MPESKIRKKKGLTAPPTSARKHSVKIGSPRWLVPVMVACFVIGLAWIVVYYVAGQDIAFMTTLGNFWNVAIGFGIISVGFALSTRWR